MSMEALGTTIDIHGGGGDLIFPHHECEIAQSESVTGEPFSRYWVHAGLVAYQGTKMSKSLGNLVFVSDLRNRSIREPSDLRSWLTTIDPISSGSTKRLSALNPIWNC